MRLRSLLVQTLLANLVLVVAAVVAALLAAQPGSLEDSAIGGATVLGLAIALSIAVNLWLVERRFVPLEQLIDQMEKANLAGAKPELLADPDPGGRPDSSEVERLDRAFRRMLGRLEAERRRSGRVALEAQERERARVARDLHDEVNQALTGILLHLEAARTKAPSELVPELAETKAYANQAMAELLRLARRLRPTALDDLGLKAALAGIVEDLDRHTEIDATFAAAGELSDLPHEVQLVFYRVGQEAATNAVQHAQPATVRMQLDRDAGQLTLTVSDDGRGFVFDEASTGTGLAGMQERAMLVGAQLHVRSRPGEGSEVQLRMSEEQIAAAAAAAAITRPRATSGS